MTAIRYSPDGTKIFIAAEDEATGEQLAIKVNRQGFSGWYQVYNAPAGGAINVLASPADNDVMYFFGQLGGQVTLLQHIISTDTEVNIGPTVTDDQAVNVLAINPSPGFNYATEAVLTELLAFVNGDGINAGQLLHTADGGQTYTQFEAGTPTTDITALAAIWGIDGLYHGYIYAEGGQLYFSPNNGLQKQTITGGLVAQNISAIEWAST